MKKFFAALLFVALSCVTSLASDPLSSMRSLVGTWNCTYQVGKTRIAYKAVFSYDLGDNWVLERDSSAGGSDLGMFTYEPKRRGWTAIVITRQRTTTVFRAVGDNPNHIVYRSAYPDTSMTDIFDRASPTIYTLHYTQTTGGKTIKSADRCVKT
jgi:ribosomal protein L10